MTDVYKRQERGRDPVRTKIVIDGTVLEQVSSFEYLAYSVSYNASNEMVNKFNLLCGEPLSQQVKEHA